jgi:hypothetical protein
VTTDLPLLAQDDTLPPAVDSDALDRVDMSPRFTDLPSDSTNEFDDDEIFEFFTKVAEDYGPWEVGLNLGWSPMKIGRFLAEPERQAILSALRERDIDTVERAVKREARNGNMVAAKMLLYSHAAHRGWSDTRHVKVDTREQQEIIISVRAGLERATSQLVADHGEDGVAALQAAYADDDIVDGEIVED